MTLRRTVEVRADVLVDDPPAVAEAPRLQLLPMVSTDGAGMQLSLRF